MSGAPPRGRRGLTGAVPGLALVALGAAMLLWTAGLDGRPAVFTDTALYYSHGAYLFQALGLASPGDALSPGDPTALPATPGAPDISAAIDGARSVLYGAPLYGLGRIGGLWLVAIVQALAAAGVLYLLWRAALPGAPRWGYLALTAALALFSPLADFASFAMPDVFAGVAGAALLLVLVWRDRLGPARLAAVVALLAYGLGVHHSNLLVAVLVCGTAAPLLWLGGLPLRRVASRIAWVAGAAGIALVVGAVAEAPVQARAGETIGSPPFLSARVIADGPGRHYLHDRCAGPGPAFALCAYRAKPLRSADQILWSIHRRDAVFLAAGPAGRLAMERQDVRFALDAVLAHPLEEVAAATGNVLRQLVEVQSDDPRRAQGYYLHDGYWRTTSLAKLEPDPSACPTAKACRPRLGRTTATVLTIMGLVFSAAALAWALARRDVRAILSGRERPGPSDDRLRLLQAVALALALLLANAVVCGALSGPFSRYQARVVWLLPAAAGLMVVGLARRGRRALDAP